MVVAIAEKRGPLATVKLRPVGDRVVIDPLLDESSKSAGGVYIPDTAKEKPQKGRVVAAGPGRTTDDGKVVPMPVKAGDTVVYSKYAGAEYKQDGKEYLIVREADILALVG